MAKSPTARRLLGERPRDPSEVREVRDDSVVIELVEARLAAFSMERKVFEHTFKHLAYSERGVSQPLPDVSGRHN